MIKHVVCFKFKDKEDIKKAHDILLSMKGNVPQIIKLDVNIDFLHTKRSYDIILEVILNDKKALEDYQNDQYHCDIVKSFIHSASESSVSIDYFL